MEPERYLTYIICVIVFTLKAGVSSAPSETEDCNVPIHLENPNCCVSGSNDLINQPLVNQECITALLDSKVSTYEELESALECFFECIFKTADILSKEHKNIYDEVLTNITKEFNTEYATLESNKIKNCIQNDYVVKESAQCKSGSLQFFLCVHRENILNCPAEDWISSDECNKYKSALENCPKRTPIFQLFEFEHNEKRNTTE